jgi:hypothetical protein
VTFIMVWRKGPRGHPPKGANGQTGCESFHFYFPRKTLPDSRLPKWQRRQSRLYVPNASRSCHDFRIVTISWISRIRRLLLIVPEYLVDLKLTDVPFTSWT